MLVLRAVACSFVFVSLLPACPAKDDGGSFGEAKPTKNDGTIGKPMKAPEPPPDFDGSISVAPAFDKAQNKLTVTLQLKPGFHAYAPGESVGKPVALTLDAENGWAVEGAVEIPAGTKKDLGELGTSMILEGDVPLRATVKPGSGALSGVVEVQICTDKACDRPKKHAWSIPAT